MGVSYQGQEGQSAQPQIRDILFHGVPLPQNAAEPTLFERPPNFRENANRADLGLRPDRPALFLAQGADIDISGPEFDFVRSIRVFDVRYAEQYNAGSEGGCIRSASVVVGRYGIQGAFSWARTSPDILPPAYVGLEDWGIDCPQVSNRSVFVEWRDFEGTYGFEQVNY